LCLSAGLAARPSREEWVDLSDGPSLLGRLVPAERARMHVHSHKRIGGFTRAAWMEHFRKSLFRF
jgi:hypothetical protein